MTTQQLRDAWAPACDGSRMVTIPLGDNGARVTVDRRWEPAIRALDAVFRHFGYEVRPADTGAFVCRAITNGVLYSLHAFGIAVDVNWQTNPYGPVLRTDMPPDMIRAIEAIRTVDGLQVFRWGGRYSGNKDAMHFEPQVTPAQIARGIDWGTVAGFSEGDIDMAAADDIKAGMLALYIKTEVSQELTRTVVRRQARKTRALISGVDADLSSISSEVAAIRSAVLDRAKVEAKRLGVPEHAVAESLDAAVADVDLSDDD